MNTQITTAGIAAFLETKCRQVMALTGCSEATVSVNQRVSEPRAISDHAYYSAHAWGECSMGEDLEEVIAAIAEKVGTASEIAARKRREAARLLAEADEIAPIAEPERDEIPAHHSLERAAVAEANDIVRYGLPPEGEATYGR